MFEEKAMRIMIARILGPMLLALFLGGAVRAQEMTGQGAEKTKKELLDLETSKGKNLVASAAAAADWQDHFCADGVALTLPDGSTPSKAELVAMIRSGDIKDELINHHDYHVHVYGINGVAHTGVVTWTGDEITSYKGKREHVYEKTTDVFAKVDSGEWKRVVHHVSPIPPGIVPLN
jgi:ketosteroid isomerase-like protein